MRIVDGHHFSFRNLSHASRTDLGSPHPAGKEALLRSYFSWSWLVSLRWPLDPGPSALLRVHSQLPLLLLLLCLLLRRLLPLHRPLLLPLLVQHHPVKVPLLHSLLRLLLRSSLVPAA